VRVTRRRILLVSTALIVAAFIGFTVWAYTPLGPAQKAVNSLVDSETVSITQGKNIIFHPSEPVDTGIIIYQGGHVDPRSYSVLAHRLAEEGYTVFIPKMRFNLAVLDKKAALEIVKDNPEIDKWVLTGHSLGGAMAASLVYDDPDVFQGLVLLAAYPPKNNDLSSYEIKVTTIYGSKDKVASPTQIEESFKLLPPESRKVLIEGGNHAQFGYYGKQKGDGTATITLIEQQKIVLEEILNITQ
jgi:pimeloyl-ACP methyl ester carboxylesterase